MVAHSLSGTGYLVSNRRCSLSYLVSVAKMSILLNLIVVILFFFFLLLSGTFEAEDEQVVYGLTHPVNSFDPIMLQVL